MAGVAVVTGGGFNIGRAVAEDLAAAGFDVVVASRNAANLQATVEAIESAGGRGLAVPTDVTSIEQTVRLAERASEFGPVDVLVAAAGGGEAVPIDTGEPERHLAVLSRNLVSTLLTCRAFVPVLRARPHGRIVTFAGGGAFFPILGQDLTAYAAAKAGVCRLTDQLQAELWATSIDVNAVEPGTVAPGDVEAALRAVEPVRFLATAAPGLVRGRILSAGDTWWRDPDRVRMVAQSDAAFRLRRDDSLS